LLALRVFATPLFAADPIVGAWIPNTAKTTNTTGNPPKNVMLLIDEQGTNLQVTGTGTNSN
jgi:ABC-type hemin transport system substrate-binding protein